MYGDRECETKSSITSGRKLKLKISILYLSSDSISSISRILRIIGNILDCFAIVMLYRINTILIVHLPLTLNTHTFVKKNMDKYIHMFLKLKYKNAKSTDI